MRRFYYYGCRGSDSGHYLFSEFSSHRGGAIAGGFPAFILDGAFAPLDTNDTGWKLTHLRYNHQILSILARHDNTIDSRPGSNACFVVMDAEPWDEEPILAQMQKSFPDCWQRLTKETL